jgi:hypothetical protein
MTKLYMRRAHNARDIFKLVSISINSYKSRRFFVASGPRVNGVRLAMVPHVGSMRRRSARGPVARCIGRSVVLLEVQHIARGKSSRKRINGARWS